MAAVVFLLTDGVSEHVDEGTITAEFDSTLRNGECLVGLGQYDFGVSAVA